MRAIVNLILPLGLVCLAAACADRSATAPARSEVAAPRSGPALVVTPENMAGWTMRVGGSSSASFERGPSAQPLGTGSIRFAVGTSPEDEVSFRNQNYIGTKLGELTDLEYSFFVSQAESGGAAPFILLPVDLNNDGFIDDQLMFRPSSPEPNTWQSWDALRGGWWSMSVVGRPDDRGIRSLSAYVEAAPEARIASAIIVGIWDSGGSRRMVGQLDAFVIGVNGSRTVYDFEPSGGAADERGPS